MQMSRFRVFLVGCILTSFVSGCGDAVEAPIEKSPYAPTQEQADKMRESMTKGMRGKTAKKPASAPKKD